MKKNHEHDTEPFFVDLLGFYRILQKKLKRVIAFQTQTESTAENVCMGSLFHFQNTTMTITRISTHVNLGLMCTLL